jgi:HAD superfamily hydrolase (TIGR01549 family)
MHSRDITASRNVMVQAVCFDAFGTLCRIGERHRPYEALFARLGVDLREGARLAMTSSETLPELAARLGDARAAEGLVAGLEAESASITLFEDVAETLARLREIGIRAWVVSNLAAPYGPPLRPLLGDSVCGLSLSYEVGAIKPDPAIFAHACRGLSLDPSRVLMVGDSRRADVEGAEAFGLRALWLRRGRASHGPRSIGSLVEIFPKSA